MQRGTFLCIVLAALLWPVAFKAQVMQEELACQVNGYDLIIQNVSDEIYPVGEIIDWSVRFSRSAGAHLLLKPFEPGARIYLTGALGSSYLVPGTPCTVAFAQAEAAEDEGGAEDGH